MSCLRAKPIVDGLEVEWGERVRIVRLNAMERDNLTLLSRLGVRFMPTYVLLDSDGRELWRSIGGINAREARAMVEQLP